MTTQTTVNWKNWRFQSYRLDARGKELHQVSTWSLVTDTAIVGKKEALISILMKAKQANDNPDIVKQRLNLQELWAEMKSKLLKLGMLTPSRVLTDSMLFLASSNPKQRWWRRNQFGGTISLQCLLPTAICLEWYESNWFCRGWNSLSQTTCIRSLWWAVVK